MRLDRRGFSLVELLVATALAGIAGAVMTTTLSRQQRFFASASEVLDTRAQIRDGAGVLVSDIRSAAVARFGMPVMQDSAIEMFVVVASSVACSAPSGATIGLAPQQLAMGNTLTSILFLPDTGDLAMLYAAGDSVMPGAWETGRLVSFTSRSLATSCPSSTGFTTAADATAGTTGYVLTLAVPPGPGIRRGAPIVFIRRVRYSLYRSSDGYWYLGYRRCGVASGGCAAIQPVSGPYRAYSASGDSGLSFRYYSASGLPVSAPSMAVARVDIVVRGRTSMAAGLNGDAKAAYSDSIVVSVAPRNHQ
ncbi:MAG TPA: type II secretion system protein [Gemmatimonadaceae bacterium]|nr:type II secretion system protein [Gemmatimonadaceae bacterium]